MDKTTMIIIGVVAILVVIGVVMYVVKNEHYSGFVSIELQATPVLGTVAYNMDPVKLNNFFVKYLPNSSVEVTSVDQSAVHPPFQGQIVFTSNSGQVLASVPIASSSWYHTQNLSVAQLEDAIYNNPRVMEAMKKINSM
jgi:hypothetical protein